MKPIKVKYSWKYAHNALGIMIDTECYGNNLAAAIIVTSQGKIEKVDFENVTVVDQYIMKEF